MKTLISWPVLVVAGLSVAGVLGCETTTEDGAKVPIGGGGNVGVGDLSGTPLPGQQWTVQDKGGTNRPKMSDAALATYEQGMQAFRAGDLQNARKLFTQAGQTDPKAYQAFYSLGVVQERLRDDGAAQSYRQAYTVVPDYEPAIVAFAMLKARKGQTSEADSFLTQKRNELPKSAPVLAALAEVKSLSKDTGNAQKLASEALKLDPQYKPAMIVIARDHWRARKIDLAELALKAILDGLDEDAAKDKDNPEALLLRGVIKKEKGDRAGAIENFQKAVARRPDMVEARLQLATFLLQAGSAEQALPLVEGALRFDADSLPAHLLLGDTYRLQGKYTEAKQRFDHVISKDASLPQTHYNLGLLYLNAPSMPGMTPMQQVDAATASFKKYQDLRPKGQADDSDELINRAKLKRGELEAAASAAQPVAPPPTPPATPPADPKAGEKKP